MNTYKDRYGCERYVGTDEKVRSKNNVNRIIARQHGMPLYVDIDGQWRSVQTDRIVSKPRWGYYIRKHSSPTYVWLCDRHGRVKFWKDTERCVKCSPRRK